MRLFSVTLLLLAAILDLPGASLEAWPEYRRPDPFGATVAADRTDSPMRLELAGARGGYVSFHLLVKLEEGGSYALDLRLGGNAAGVEIDLFREWYHHPNKDGSYYPDALIPVSAPYESQLPEPSNRVENQTTQAFWVDLWIGRDAAPGTLECKAVLRAAGRETILPIQVDVLPATIPEDDIPTIDHNSYGSSWIAGYYKRAGEQADEFFSSDRFFQLIHAHYRIFYEHRGTFHQLGYGHGGKVGPEFAPSLAGTGRNRRIESWDLYDRHYGPLLDGSAFAGSRRGAKPIPMVYLPINPEWPASFLWWGEPGYETEFSNVVSGMERHFREKGWTHTRFELFFNHKKRYKAFQWDGDEARFAKDNQYFRDYWQLFQRALPKQTPVQFVFRNDASWMMEQQVQELAGVVNFWVLSRSILSWSPDIPRTLRERGDISWFYSSPPSAFEPSSAITKHLLTAWIWGVDGYIHWLTVSPGNDPWFRFDGATLGLIYPGVRFGVDGPIPSIRLKLQRNCLQDIALLERLGGDPAEVTRRYNETKPEEWWMPRPKLADRPPHEWSNNDLGEAVPLDERLFENLDPDAWVRTREYVRQLASEAK